MRIVIVEDEAFIAMMLEDMLLELGHEVVGHAPDVETALGVIADTPFDIAILDINLRRSHSYPIAAQLKELGKPFIFATGYSVEGIEEAWQSTVRVQKPYAPAALANALAAAMRRHG